MTGTFDKRLQELLADNVRGSRAVAADAVALFGELFGDSSLSESELKEIASGACARLRKAHPSLVAVQKLCGAVKSAIATEGGSVRERVGGVLGQWRGDRFETMAAAMAEHLMPMLKPGCRVLCHSHSSTVLGVLKRVNRELKNLRVVQTVSEPMKEGIRMARELAGGDIEVRLIADAGAAGAVGECDLVLLGADSVSKSGVVNKLGSFGIALAARYFGVPVYAVADSTKLVAGDVNPVIEKHDPAELTDFRHPRVEVVNVYFDITPLELFTGVVTEEEIFTPKSLCTRL